MQTQTLPPVPDDWPVQPLGTISAGLAADPVTCGTCHRTWDDAIPTAITPAPAGCCPFEYFHAEPEPSHHLRPFPTDGLCPACEHPEQLRYCEKIIQSRGRIEQDDDGTWIIGSYISETFDEDNDGEWLECPHCLAGPFALPDEFDWA